MPEKSTEAHLFSKICGYNNELQRTQRPGKFLQIEIKVFAKWQNYKTPLSCVRLKKKTFLKLLFKKISHINCYHLGGVLLPARIFSSLAQDDMTFFPGFLILNLAGHKIQRIGYNRPRLLTHSTLLSPSI